MFELKEVKINLLRWLIDFCNSDLQSMRENEKERLALQLENFSVLAASKQSEDEAVLNVEERKSVTLSYDKKQLARLYADFRRKSVGEFLKEIRKPLGARGVNDESMKLMQETVRNFFELFIMERKRIDGHQKPAILGFEIVRGLVPSFWITPEKFQLNYDIFLGKEETIKIAVRDEEGVDLYTLEESKRVKGSLKKRGVFLSSKKLRESIMLTLRLFNWSQFILNFCALLNNVPTEWIQKCRGCSRYFLNPYKREKIYCNTSCASRSIARQKYEGLRKDPKKYKAHLKKYRKYSNERYRRLRMMQFGPNIKIGRKAHHKK
jgi:hypothetical protein